MDGEERKGKETDRQTDRLSERERELERKAVFVVSSQLGGGVVRITSGYIIKKGYSWCEGEDERMLIDPF